MEQSPSWEANLFAASQKFPAVLWNPKVHYRIHQFPSPVPILSQLDPIHTPTSHFLRSNLIIILPSTPGSPKWSLSPRFSHQNPVHPLPSPICATCPAHLILLDFITRTILDEYRTLSSSLCTGWGISRLTPLYPTNGLLYAPGSQYIVVGVKLYEMRDMGATAAILDPTLEF